MNLRFILFAIFYFLAAGLSGCATIKEVGKGVAGVSTQVLEDKRKDALKKSFAFNYNDCYDRVKEILKGTDNGEGLGPYIYSADAKKKMIAIYLSPEDTTPVGIFFTEESKGSTLIEVSSPSTYAKEEIADIIFSRLNKRINPKIIEEKKTNVK